MKENKQEEEFINPIDIDKVAENPHLLPYAHTVGGSVIKPIDKGRVKGLSLDAMYEQTNVHLSQIRKQVETLIQQAQEVHDRVAISEKIYQADMGFKPLIGCIYFLYQKADESYVLSMIGSEEWGDNPPYEFVSEVKLLSDHTWEIISSNI
jgi:hypothetical protein